MKCQRCGYENNDSSKFCINCTYPLNTEHSNNNKIDRKSRWSKLSMGRKVFIVLGIIIIALLLFSIIESISAPNENSSLNLVTTNQSSYDSSYHPFQVKVIYNGSWYGDAGTEKYTYEYSDVGDDLIRLDSSPWDDVSVNIHKNDYTSKKLTVQLIKDGEVIGENSTTKPNGNVILHN